jgi:3-hydroxybutyryl-CoA dehydrogenase
VSGAEPKQTGGAEPPQTGGAEPPRARVAAAGAGRMGRGIALAFAWGGHEVDLIDLKARDDAGRRRIAEDAHAEMAASLAMLAELDALPAHGVQLRERLVSDGVKPCSQSQLAAAPGK